MRVCRSATNPTPSATNRSGCCSITPGAPKKPPPDRRAKPLSGASPLPVRTSGPGKAVPDTRCRYSAKDAVSMSGAAVPRSLRSPPRRRPRRRSQGRPKSRPNESGRRSWRARPRRKRSARMQRADSAKKRKRSGAGRNNWPDLKRKRSGRRRPREPRRVPSRRRPPPKPRGRRNASASAPRTGLTGRRKGSAPGTTNSETAGLAGGNYR